MEKKYKDIAKHYEDCLIKHGDSHKGVDWPNIEDARTRYRIMLELIKGGDQVSLLDFGCGAAHLLEYINEESLTHINYKGLDISEKFISLSERKFPENNFYCLDFLKENYKLPSFDYIVFNGVFTEKVNLSFDEMWEFFTELLRLSFAKAHKGIAFNVMSKHVDWEREDLFHVPFDKLADFLGKNLTRNYIFRNDYGLYEYTTYIYK